VNDLGVIEFFAELSLIFLMAYVLWWVDWQVKGEWPLPPQVKGEWPHPLHLPINPALEGVWGGGVLYQYINILSDSFLLENFSSWDPISKNEVSNVCKTI
jgi:hypothetical protein